MLKLKNLYDKKEIKRFILVGIFTVIIDYLIYTLISHIGVILSIAKGCGFVSGAYFSYYMNKNLTFKIRTNSNKQIIKFTLLYLTSLMLNIVSNSLVLNLYPIESNFKYQISFIIATSLSAVYNFIGMKMVVFAKPTKSNDH